jgi:hypothetical protein
LEPNAGCIHWCKLILQIFLVLWLNFCTGPSMQMWYESQCFKKMIFLIFGTFSLTWPQELEDCTYDAKLSFLFQKKCWIFLFLKAVIWS